MDTCPDQWLCRELMGFLAPIRIGEREPGQPLAVGRKIADEYFQEEEQRATMAELAMQ